MEYTKEALDVARAFMKLPENERHIEIAALRYSNAKPHAELAAVSGPPGAMSPDDATPDADAKARAAAFLAPCWSRQRARSAPPRQRRRAAGSDARWGAGKRRKENR